MGSNEQAAADGTTPRVAMCHGGLHLGEMMLSLVPDTYSHAKMSYPTFASVLGGIRISVFDIIHLPLTLMACLVQQDDVTSVWDFDASAEKRDTEGGTSRRSVLEQAEKLHRHM